MTKQKKNNFVYSIRITKEQRDLLKSNTEIKKQLDGMVKEFLELNLIMKQKEK